MLYVQQKISEQNFIVADTDDNTEELTTRKELKHCVIDLGVEVSGATLSSDNLFNIHCYNNLTDAWALKMKIFRGISLMIDKTGTLCNMELDTQRDISHVLNLEDCCTSLANYCFENIKVVNNSVDLKVILTDKIKFNSKAFESCRWSKLKFDFSQLSDKKAEVAYKSFLTDRGSCLILGSNQILSNVEIIDKRERYAYYIILKALLHKDATNFYTVQSLTPKRLYCSAMEEITKLYRPKWIEMCNSNIKLDLQGERPALVVDKANLTNVNAILNAVERFGINLDKFTFSMIATYLDLVCTADFDLVDAVMNLGKRLKSMYNL